MATPRIGVIGSNMVDLVTTVSRMPAAGETLAAPSFAMGHGGKGANQAVAARKLGAEVTLVTCVGDDLFGAGTIRNFEALGMSTKHVRTVAGTASGVAPIFVEPSGENRILIVPGANLALMPDDVDRAAADLAQCDLLLLQLEIPFETVAYVIAWGASHNVRVVLNPAPATPGLDLARLRGLAYLIPNQTELTLLTGRPAETAEQAAEAARPLLDHGIGAIIVTLGGEGALLVTPDRTLQVPAVPTTVRDTTGAGDAFIGAFATHLAQYGDPVAAMRQGAAYAADAISRPGTQSSFADAAQFATFLATL